MQPNLPTDYYLDNVLILFEHVESLYRDIIPETDLEFLESFSGLTTDAKRLYIRLLNRSHVLFRLSKLNYAEIGSIPSAMQELESLDFLKIDQETVSIAGGIILFLIALRMIFPQPGGVMSLTEGEEPFIVPLAIPLIAGPSTMALLILLSNQEPNKMMDWSIALFAAWAATAIILSFSSLFHRILGEKGLNAVERLMGMILVMIAIQMFLNGISAYVNTISI
mgnify:CR=1 FL=1